MPSGRPTSSSRSSHPKARPTLFLGDPDLALASVIVATVWQFTGYNMLLYYAGLQNLPRDQLEAASIDGAGKGASIRHVIVPSLYPVIGTADPAQRHRRACASSSSST